MSRISTCFKDLHLEGRKALIPYITAGDPDPGDTVPLAHAFVKAGADIIELGVPFSDPMADGPVIQRASERALAQHINLPQVLAMVREFRQQDSKTPVVLMGYLNPIEAMGYQVFAQAAAQAGVDGILVVDMPPEEAKALVTEITQFEMDPIFLIAPTTSKERIKIICDIARGYVYYVSLKGVTGAATLDVASVAHNIAQIRNETDLPIGVGFGIKDAESAKTIAGVADAVVVGSAIIQKIEQQMSRRSNMIEEAAALIASMRRAMDAEINKVTS
ncbi:MAG: tryptophan synthase subunit alpha [Gammaproteobacteria bacterium]|nr:tryptophan synthase subunit alpha [Gammaproteobacteria bacterium]